MEVKYVGTPPVFWICIDDRPIVSAYEAWEATGQIPVPSTPISDLERLAQAALARRGKWLYLPGTMLECHNCGAKWTSENYLVGYLHDGKSRKVRLTDFSTCPAGHFDTHWAIVADKENR